MRKKRLLDYCREAMCGRRAILTWAAVFLQVCVLSAQGSMKKASASLTTSTDDFLGDYESRTWTASDGLTGNTINAIIQDEDGFLYIATYDGLVRFDGVEFVTMNRTYNEKYDFSSARSLYQDTQGNIWVGSNDEGLAQIARDGTVQMFTMNSGLPNNSVRAIQEDIDGNIWVGTAAGVVYITPSEEVVIPNGLEQYGEEHILVNTLYCDTAGRMWLTSRNPGSIYIFEGGEFRRYEGIHTKIKPSVTTIEQDSRGAFLFGLAPHYVLKLDSGNETYYDVGIGEQPGTIVNSIMQDKVGNFWIATDAGLCILGTGGNVYSYNTKHGLADSSINQVMQDKEGNVWLATDKGGLERLSLSKFKTVNLGTTVNAIAQDDERKVVWLGKDDGLYCCDYALKEVSNEDVDKIVDYCRNIRIRHVGMTRDGGLLISTYEKRGQILFEKDGSIKQWTVRNGLTGNKVRVAIEAQNGDIYIGTTTGLNIADRETSSLTRITQEDGLPNGYIMCIFQDSRGTVWCGTDGGGVFTLKTLEGGRHQVDRIYTSANTLTGRLSFSDTCIAGNVVFKISEPRKGEIWFCTGTGISRLKDGVFSNITAVNGLGTDSVFQMVNEYVDRVWMTSNRGIASVKFSQMEDVADGKTSRLNVKFFTSNDGIHSSGVTATSLSMKDSTGRIWFTMGDGFVIYDPVKATADKVVPRVATDRIIIDNKEIVCDGSPVIVPPEAKRVVIKYTAPSFVSPEQMLFRYRLSGFETRYTDWVQERSVSYTNLKPGSYEFTVMAQNANEVSSLMSDVLKIVKKPYFHQMWFFWPLVVLFAAAVVWLLALLRMREYRRYQKMLEEEVDRQTAEIKQKSRDLEVAKNKSERLLLNILPQTVARELTDSPNKIIADQHNAATILFSDIVGFTKLSSSMKAAEVVTMLNDLFSLFDIRAEAEGVEKIKTIGDSYMAVCGLGSNDARRSAASMIRFAKGMLEDLNNFNASTGLNLQMRIGINTGLIVAGVIGKTKFIYDIWGDAVNVASRMESTSMPGWIHVTQNTYLVAKGDYAFDGPIEVDVKGKGVMKTYFVKSNGTAQ